MLLMWLIGLIGLIISIEPELKFTLICIVAGFVASNRNESL